MKPIIAITMGDAAGVGPEIIAKAFTKEWIFTNCRPVVIGDSSILAKAVEIVGATLKINRMKDLHQAVFTDGTIDCLDLELLDRTLPFGEISKSAGNAAFRYLEKAIELANNKEITAICTAPLNKEALHLAGHQYPGHTEILAELTGTKEYAMMLSAPNLRVIHATTHVGLIKAIESISPERVLKVIRLADQTLKKAGVQQPRIGVCGINPHAGENGLFGNGEEEEKIIPAISEAASEGIDAAGPLPADTLFFRAARGDFDIVVAMYHDQGHIPIKVMGIESGVNITVGLPIIRTSVDHGTAFDIAGKGIASEESLEEALRQAIKLAPVQ
ncbi:4-hydroxythreonine-4-phosphate dehydrogenase PdxA [Bacillus massiliglaciei]|uniref:4-hydroxythreonine-4-phosphate dehydrogenase PdxA n=1 Tax=Bacillus massiliglaciei TaxID=1816693 RepID=UPI000AEB68E1|nr:4-hydroxythreonine-4-phosphate dehydrogenase PdxA [Bacillus massiliglaciei]